MQKRIEIASGEVNGPHTRVVDKGERKGDFGKVSPRASGERVAGRGVGKRDHPPSLRI